MTALWSYVQGYLEARPFDWRAWGKRPTGKKLQEEVDELLEALLELHNFEDQFDNGLMPYDSEEGDKLLNHVWEEIGDVAVCLGYIAKCHGMSVEECVRLKTEKDRGRGGTAAKEVTG